MKIAINIPQVHRAMWQHVGEAVVQRHRSTPFTTSLELSDWLHQNWPNPRTEWRTHDSGSPLELIERATGTVLMTITCTPAY